MAKARKPTAFSAAERFLDFHNRSGSATVAPFPDDDLPDLVESDIWYSESSDGPTVTSDREPETTDRAPRRVGGLSRAFTDGRQMAASAPVEVPAWPSRFAELEPEPAPPCEQEQEDADGWVPPHVYLARRAARASVIEGVGRTLKGRDASRVRDAVWSRTGFPG